MQPIVLRLEVDRDADPISGTLWLPGQARRAFSGWLALTDAIESIRATSLDELSDPREVSDEERT